MTNQAQRRWGIFALAVAMMILNLISNATLGKKSSLYIVFWGYIAYLAYKGDVDSIFQWVKWVLIINVVVGLGFSLFADDDMMGWHGFGSVGEFLIALGIPVAIKGGLLLYLNDQRASAKTNSDSNTIDSRSSTPPTERSVGAVNKIAIQKRIEDMESAYAGAYQTDSLEKVTGNMLYSGSDVRVKKRLQSLIEFGKSGSEIKSYLEALDAGGHRDSLIERNIDRPVEELLAVLAEECEKTNSPLIEIKNPEVAASVLELYKKLKKLNPRKASELLEVVSILRDDVDFNALVEKFRPQIIHESQLQNAKINLLSKARAKKLSGEEAIEVINRCGGSASIKYGSKVQYFVRWIDGAEQILYYEGVLAFVADVVVPYADANGTDL